MTEVTVILYPGVTARVPGNASITIKPGEL